ncbi:MAG: response regulator [Pseudomonadota bacterium]
MNRLRVLVVDDDRDFAESLAMVIESRGHTVALAHSGLEAVERFQREDADISFIDVKLPGMSGLESFLEIRKTRPDAKVVMMTGYSVEQLLAQAVDAGAWGVLRKPLEMPAVVEMLESLNSRPVLIADDDPDFATAIGNLLTDRGWKAHIAKDAREAVEMALSPDLEALILDVRMPVLNGLETYLELKRTGHAIPTIVVTAYADEERGSIERPLAESAWGIMRKPFDPRALIGALEGLAQQKRELR